MSTIYGSVWEIDYIKGQSLPKVSRDLLPWLLKDRKEAMEGAMVKATNKDGKTEIVHNGEGLERAERDLRRAKQSLASEKKLETIAFLREQLSIAEAKTTFYRGKIFILDQVIENTKRA